VHRTSVQRCVVRKVRAYPYPLPHAQPSGLSPGATAQSCQFNQRVVGSGQSVIRRTERFARTNPTELSALVQWKKENALRTTMDDAQTNITTLRPRQPYIEQGEPAQTVAYCTFLFSFSHNADVLCNQIMYVRKSAGGGFGSIDIHRCGLVVLHVP